MPTLPTLSGRDVVKAFVRDGWKMARQRGSHTATETYTWDYENPLIQIDKKNPCPDVRLGIHTYAYAYRIRRILRDESLASGVKTQIVFSGGTSVREYDNAAVTPTVEYIRGSGILYTITRDPLGLVDGPNVYTYVTQNPWTKFDPEGLFWKEAGEYVGEILQGWTEFNGNSTVGRPLRASSYTRRD